MMNETIILYTPTNVLDIEQLNKNIYALFENSPKPKFVFVNLSTSQFPKRISDLPFPLKQIFMTNPRVKVVWDGNMPDLQEEDFILKDVYGIDDVTSIRSLTEKHYDFHKTAESENYDVIVSLTSFPNRFQNFNLMMKCLDSLVNQNTEYKYHMVITIFKDDVPKISNMMFDYCRKNQIEILPCEEDLLGNKKYFYAMQKYAGLPLIVVDDDLIFFDNLIQDLMDKYQSDKNVIWTGWCQVMNLSDDGRLVYDVTLNNNMESEVPSFRYKFGSGSGTLIPEYMIDDFDYVLKLIHSSDNVYHDELILKKISMDKGIKVGLCKNKKYRCNIGGWLTPTQFIQNEIQPLVETSGNLHTINCSKVVVDGKTVYRGMNTEMSLLGDYVIKDDSCMLIKNQNEV